MSSPENASTTDAYIAKVRAGVRPSPAEALGFLRAFHAAHPGITAESFTRYRTAAGQTSYELFADRIAQDLRGGERVARGVLDLACGDGVLCVSLRSKVGDACPLVGVDTSAEDIALATARFAGDSHARFLCEPAQRTSLETASVDVVACHFALMLMNDAPAVVREIARVLAPGGSFHALVPSRSSAARFATPFAALIAEVLARDVPAFPDLGLGDPAFATEAGIASLFRDHAELAELAEEESSAAFGPVTFDCVPLRVDDTPERCLALVEGLYWFHMLTPESRARLRGEGRRALDAARDMGGRVPGAFDLLLVRAERAATASRRTRLSK